jgi:putative transcriptional regulator
MPGLAPENLNEVSKVLNCQPGEVLEFEPDDNKGREFSIVDIG